MSEFQAYEFQAIDRPLTADEQRELRRFSSRAEITARRFAVDYSWGDFKGDSRAWMNKYFDAFLHLANWGTRELSLRLPKSALPLETAELYCLGDTAFAREHGDHVVLEFRIEDECGDPWIEEDDDTLDRVVPIRSELMNGDFRALYIAWLACARRGDLDDAELEPPCPPGLMSLSPALEEFATFLDVDTDLLDAAAAHSPAQTAPDDARFEAWLLALPEQEKSDLLLKLVRGESAGVRAALVRRFRETAADATGCEPRRTVAELLKAAEALVEKRERAEEAKKAREEARRAREVAEARERQLTALAARADAAWAEVDAHIATRMPKRYDEAVRLLTDLREVSVRAGREAFAAQRIARLCALHASKPTLLRRLQVAGLVTA